MAAEASAGPAGFGGSCRPNSWKSLGEHGTHEHTQYICANFHHYLYDTYSRLLWSLHLHLLIFVLSKKPLMPGQRTTKNPSVPPQTQPPSPLPGPAARPRPSAPQLPLAPQTAMRWGTTKGSLGPKQVQHFLFHLSGQPPKANMMGHLFKPIRPRLPWHFGRRLRHCWWRLRHHRWWRLRHRWWRLRHR